MAAVCAHVYGATRKFVTFFRVCLSHCIVNAGHFFPLDDGPATCGETLDVDLGADFFLHCPAVSSISSGTNASLFWSFGELGAEEATLIDSLKLPGLPQTTSDGVGSRGSYSLTADGSLLVRESTRYGVTRYWCHVFPEGGSLLRSCVDVKSECPKSK